MAGYTHARLTPEVMLAHGLGTAWEQQVRAGAEQWYLVAPDGRPADWPLLDSEAKAEAEARDFNRSDADWLERSEATWQARMAGDMEA